MAKVTLPEMEPEEVEELLKKQTSAAIKNAKGRIIDKDGSVMQTMYILEQEIHRILSGEMIYPLT